ncbi:MAG: glutathione S-transferase family protein [Halothece sp. Uz-M2-17]|nr:glutathione S-transferase family protein [Halothece sp. Uz-M2-17]
MNRILYYHPQSHFSRKVRILLSEKNLDYQLEAIDLRFKPEWFLKISPIGKVPVLVDEDGTVIWDSSLIAEYLEERYPQPRFYPNAFPERLACRKWEELGDTLGDCIIQFWIQGLLNQGQSTKYQGRLKEKIDRLLPVFEAQLTHNDYLLGGDTWSIADVSALCSFGYYDLRLHEDWKEDYPHLATWFKQLHTIESVKSTIPPQQV